MKYGLLWYWSVRSSSPENFFFKSNPHDEILTFFRVLLPTGYLSIIGISSIFFSFSALRKLKTALFLIFYLPFLFRLPTVIPPYGLYQMQDSAPSVLTLVSVRHPNRICPVSITESEKNCSSVFAFRHFMPVFHRKD